jgi:predicted RNA binding protein YcfA (HicA-like mRNA interferase family)
MSKLPQLSGQEAIKVLEKIGFRVRRQRGSHVVLRRDDPFRQLVVPDHKQLDRGTLRSILRQASLEVRDLLELLRR